MSDAATSRAPIGFRTRTYRNALIAFLTAVVMLLPMLVSTSSARAADAEPPVPAGSIDQVAIRMLSDGTSDVAGDDAADNGEVATRNTVAYQWQATLVGAVGTISQTLPEGWSWDTNSLNAAFVYDGTQYGTQYELSDDGRTVTVSVESTCSAGAQGVQFQQILARPSTAAALGTAYAADLTVVDGEGERTVVGPEVTVVATSQFLLNKATVSSTLARDENGDYYLEYHVRLAARSDVVGSVDGARFALPLTVRDELTTDIAGGVMTLRSQPSDPDVEATLTQSGSTADIVYTSRSGADSAWIDGANSTMRVRVTFPAGNVPMQAHDDTPVNVANAVRPVGVVRDQHGNEMRMTQNNSASTNVIVKQPSTGGVAPTFETDRWYFANTTAGAAVFPLTGDPNRTPGWLNQPGTFVRAGSVTEIRMWAHGSRPAPDAVDPGLAGATLAAFWDPSQATLEINDDGTVSVPVLTNVNGVLMDTSRYVVEFTDARGSDQASWHASASAVRGAIAGVRVRYIDPTPLGGSDDEYMIVAFPLRLSADLPAGTVVKSHREARGEYQGAVIGADRDRDVQVTIASARTRITGSSPQQQGGTSSGNTLRYTFSPSLANALGAGNDARSSGPVSVLITLDPCVTGIDSSSLAGGWTAEQVSAAQLGADGVCGSGDAGEAGPVYRFTHDPVDITAVLPNYMAMDAISFTADTSLVAPRDGNYQALSKVEKSPVLDESQHSFTVIVRQASIVSQQQSAAATEAQLNDTTVTWNNVWVNYQSTDRPDSTFVTVLPYNGDDRGTSFHGTLQVRSAQLVGSDTDGATVEYTTADPAAITSAPADSVIWVPAPADFSDVTGVTALRVSLDALRKQSNGGLQVIAEIAGQRIGDVYASSLHGLLSEGVTGLGGEQSLGETRSSRITVVGATISGIVFHDADRDGAFTEGDAGIGDVPVHLESADGSVSIDVDTSADGTYSAQVPAGEYAVSVDEEDVPREYRTSAENPMTVTAVTGETAAGADFGFADYTAEMTFAKRVVNADAAPFVRGDTIEYAFEVGNASENAPLHDVTIDDALEGLSAIEYDWPGAAGELGTAGSGEDTVTATASYTVTQEDVDRGRVRNTATATAKDPLQRELSKTEQVRVATFGEGAIELSKTADTSGVGVPAAPGDTIRYEFTVHNTGTLSIEELQIEDAMPGLSALTVDAWPGADGELAPGEQVTAHASYTVTQADIDAGSVTNTATALAEAGNDDVEAAPATATVQFERVAALQLVKSADASALHAPAQPGDVIGYEFTITNTGSLTVRDAAIDDELAGLSDIEYDWPNADGALAPGAVVRAHAAYTVTQADIDAGAVHNTATAIATAPTGAIESGPASVSVALEASSALTLVKTATVSSEGAAKVGDEIAYEFTLTNTGTRTVTQASISDGLEGLSAIEYAWPGGTGELAPGAQVTAHATYTVTQADIDAGGVENTATATGVTGAGDVDSEPASVTTPLTRAAAITLEQVGDDRAVQDPARSGDVIEYTFTATNSGNVTLSDVEIDATLEGISELAFEAWPGEDRTLAPGESVVAHASYTVTAQDIESGSVSSPAVASGLAAERTEGAASTYAELATAESFDGAQPRGARVFSDVVTVVTPLAQPDPEPQPEPDQPEQPTDDGADGGHGTDEPDSPHALPATGASATAAWTSGAFAVLLMLAGGALLVRRRRAVQ